MDIFRTVVFTCLFILASTGYLSAQATPDSVVIKQTVKADDPSQFFTRIEVYNELQYYDKRDFRLNQTIVRAVVKIGKRFTTRLDVPYVNNTLVTADGSKQSGLGDISFRLLGFKFRDRPRSALTASIEVSMNTAESRLLGTGKNLLIPMVTYTGMIPKKKMLVSFVLQQVNSVSGDQTRSDISFTKLQFIVLKALSRRTWVVLAPEWYADYVHGGLSMNMRTRLTYAPTPRMNIWLSPSAGVFGDFMGRYKWSVDVGGRYFLFKEMNFRKKIAPAEIHTPTPQHILTIFEHEQDFSALSSHPFFVSLPILKKI